jgi:hypothetical protein
MQQYHGGFELVRKGQRVVQSKPGTREKICCKENPLDLQLNHRDPRTRLKGTMTRTVAAFAMESTSHARANPMTQDSASAAELRLALQPDLNDPIRIEIEVPFYFALD